MEVLFKTYFMRLVLFAVRYVKDQDTAREIVHEVFINVWEKRDSIDEQKSVKAYLFTSVYNRCLNYIRNQKKIDTAVSVEDDYSGQHVAFEDRIEHSELEAKIQEALLQLPEKCREIFMLSRFEEKKYAEISTLLGISVKTVEAQMSKSLKMMRKALHDYFI